MNGVKLEARFCKKGTLRYISHLDVLRLFQRSVRRAELPVAISKGYSPHYKIGFGKALRLGLESDGEEIVFLLDKWIEPEEFMARLNKKLPEGIGLVACRKRY